MNGILHGLDLPVRHDTCQEDGHDAVRPVLLGRIEFAKFSCLLTKASVAPNQDPRSSVGWDVFIRICRPSAFADQLAKVALMKADV